MNRFTLALVVALLASAYSDPACAAQFKLSNHTFTVPDGFEVEQVAGPPLADRPITADFDEQGRLYVTDSSGSNDKPDKQLQDKPHRIVRLEDTDGDGRFDKSVVFADKMMFPEGALWFSGSLYVAAPPSIWKLTDTDGDGVADQRTEWFQGKTLTGCANDLHGPYLGPDGWIYWCKGAFAKQTYERPGKPPFVTRAAHIFRARPDGTEIEPVLTGGMDNPVCVAFTAGGERILTGTFFIHPGGGQRDGLIHAIYGGVYGKDHDVIYDHKRTGDLMPIMTDHGPSASCFVLRYQSGAFGEEYRDNLFACLFNLHKVMRHVLVPDGATFKTQDQDFLVSDNPDFHPTDVLEDADGSLLVVDTGGWYKLCCPTSQLWKPDVLGAIYRVRRKGMPVLSDPRGLHIAWPQARPEELCALLGDKRPVVQQKARARLAQMKSEAVPALADALRSGSVEVRRNAVWTLAWIEGEQARKAGRAALHDLDSTVRQAALHSVSVWRDSGALPDLVRLVEAGSPQLQRVAAEALGRIGDAGAVQPLLEQASKPHDRALEHSLIYALIEIDDPGVVRETLAKVDSPYGKHAALVALDQMDGGHITPGEVTPLLAASDPVLRKTAAWIIEHHSEWASALAGFLRERLAVFDSSLDQTTELEHQLSHFAHDLSVQKVLAETLEQAAVSEAARVTAMRAMAQSGLKELPAGWVRALACLLKSANARLAGAAVDVARAVPANAATAGDLVTALHAVAQDPQKPVELRLGALAALPGGLNPVTTEALDFLRANLDLSKPVSVRSTAAAVLARARLDPVQLLALTEAIKSAGPLELPKLLSAFDRATNEITGLKLVAALKESAGLSGLRPEMLSPHLTNFPAAVQREAEPLLAQLHVDAAQEKAHLEELLPALKGGDIRRGQAVFNSQKAACSSCHAIGYLGGNVGPDLTRIGQVRTERDLLESIVYPSASFVRSYEPVVVATRSGDDYSGVVRKDAPDQLILATGPGTEVRLARSDIADMRPGTVSVMPAGLDTILTRQELADLVAFLKATRW